MQRNFKTKVSAALVATLMGASTILPGISAAAATLGNDGRLNLSKNYYNGSAYLYANSNGVIFNKQKEYLRLAAGAGGGDYIYYLTSTDQSVYGICLRPSVYSGQGMTISNRTSSYLANLQTNYHEIYKAIGRAMYYGYPGAESGMYTTKSRAYAAATQMIVWEFVLGYRSATGTMQMVSGYPNLLQMYNANQAIIDAYNEISDKLSMHNNIPSNMNKTAAAARSYDKNKTIVMAYDFSMSRGNNVYGGYKGTYTLKGSNNVNGRDWTTPTTSALQSLATKWNQDKHYNRTIGAKVSSKTNNGDTTYTITADHAPQSVSSITTTNAINVNFASNAAVKNNWVVYSASDYRQDIAFATVKPDSQEAYLGVVVPNYGNIYIYKDFELDGAAVDDATAKKYAAGVTFKVRTTYNGKDYYVKADTNNNGVTYTFTEFTTDKNAATAFPLNTSTYSSSTNRFKVTLYDLPAETSSRTYTIREYVDAKSALAKAGYPVYSDTKVNEEEATVKSYNTTGPTKNASDYSVYFTNKADSEYTDIGLIKQVKDPNEGDIEAAKGQFIACVLYKNQMYYLKSLSIAQPGKYTVPSSSLNAGTFADNAAVLTTDITQAMTLFPGDAGINIHDVPIGVKFGFIEIQSEKDGNIVENGYGDDIKDNKVNFTTFKDVVSNYTKETDGVIVLDKNLGGTIFNTIGTEFPFTFGVTSTANTAKKETLINVPYYVDLVLKKTDDKGDPLENATFGLYKGDDLLERQTSDEKGNITFTYHFPTQVKESDGYYVKELSAPSGYYADTTEYKISFDKSLSSSDYKYGSAYARIATVKNLPEIVNYPYKGELHLLKSDGDTDEVMPGIIFDFTANEDMTKEEIDAIKVENGEDVKRAASDVKAGEVFMTVTTDKDGLIDLYDLSLGGVTNGNKFKRKYTATETNMPTGLYGNGPYTFEFSTSKYNKERSSVIGGAIVYASKTAYNQALPVDIKVIKKDNHDKPLANVEFEVIPDEDVVVNGRTLQEKDEVIGTLTTDKNGVAMNYTNDNTIIYDFKIYGGFKYRIVEKSAPDGIVLDKEAYHFTAPFDEKGEVEEFVYEKVNRWASANISVIKVDDRTYEPLKDAIFEIWKDADNDGELNIDNDIKIEEITTTNDDGVYTSTDKLEYGTYFVKETQAPEGYIKSDEVIKVNVENDDETVYVSNGVDPDGKKVFLERQYRGTVDLIKQDEETGAALSGAEFTLYKDVNGNNEIDEEDTEYGKLAEDPETAGRYAIDDVPYGTYIVRETEAPKDYLPDDGIYPVNIDEDGKTVTVKNSDDAFINRPKRGDITLLKYDEDYPENKLSGAEFEVYKDTDLDGKISDADEFIGNLEESKDEVGFYGIYDLRMGQYLVRETKAPKDFNLDKKTYTVVLEEDGQTVSVENEAGKGFKNSPAKGKITLTKYDSKYPDHKLSGAIFSVWKDTNGNGKYDQDEDEHIGELNESEVGVYTMDSLRIGTYFVHETKAPQYFRLDEGFYKAEITKNGDIAVVTNRDDDKSFAAGFYDDGFEGGIKITKTDMSNSKTLPNTGIALYKEDGTLIEKKYTDDKGQVEFDKLEVGKYYFVEFEAPAGYYLNTEKHYFEIKEDGVILEDTLTDEVIPTTPPTVPKTGKENNMVIPVVASVSSVMGLAAIVIVAKTRKKRED